MPDWTWATLARIATTAPLEYLLEEGALAGDEHTATQTGDRQAHGYALYFFTRRAVKLLEG
jgi:hypothetical protein